MNGVIRVTCYSGNFGGYLAISSVFCKNWGIVRGLYCNIKDHPNFFKKNKGQSAEARPFAMMGL